MSAVTTTPTTAEIKSAMTTDHHDSIVTTTVVATTEEKHDHITNGVETKPHAVTNFIPTTTNNPTASTSPTSSPPTSSQNETIEGNPVLSHGREEPKYRPIANTKPPVFATTPKTMTVTEEAIRNIQRDQQQKRNACHKTAGPIMESPTATPRDPLLPPVVQLFPSHLRTEYLKLQHPAYWDVEYHKMLQQLYHQPIPRYNHHPSLPHERNQALYCGDTYHQRIMAMSAPLPSRSSRRRYCPSKQTTMTFTKKGKTTQKHAPPAAAAENDVTRTLRALTKYDIAKAVQCLHIPPPPGTSNKNNNKKNHHPIVLVAPPSPAVPPSGNVPLRPKIVIPSSPTITSLPPSTAPLVATTTTTTTAVQLDPTSTIRPTPPPVSVMNPPPPPRMMTTIHHHHHHHGTRGVDDNVSPPPMRQVAVVSPPPNGPTGSAGDGPTTTQPPPSAQPRVRGKQWIEHFVRPLSNDNDNDGNINNYTDDDEDEGDLLLCLDEILSVSDDSLYGAGDDDNDDDDEHEIAMTLCDA